MPESRKKLKKNESTKKKRAELRVSLKVLREIRESIGSHPPEYGGVLGGSRDDGIVRHFVFDSKACRTQGTYSPDCEMLNRLFAEDWNPKGINLLGFVHSHPGFFGHPTSEDVQYSAELLRGIPELSALLIPIVLTVPGSGRFEFIPFAAVRDGESVRWEALDLLVLGDNDEPIVDLEREFGARSAVSLCSSVTKMIADGSCGALDSPTSQEVEVGGASGVSRVSTADSVYQSDTFERATTAYNLDLMRDSRLIYIGAGGAASVIEELARTGIGQHVLIDPDVVSETNLATQQTYRRDLGRPKVKCIQERIKDINPDAVVLALDKSLDAIDDEEFERLATLGIEGRMPARTLICGFTDNFEAQARVHRLVLQLGIPSLCAQVYPEGRGAEITFTHPDVTPACHRCVLGARYRAYLDEAYRNTVTSHGAPIFSTGRLNALKGFIALAILHHGTEHPRWGQLLTRIGKRNLILIRMDPDLAETLGLSVFDKVLGGGDQDRILFDETVWLPQRPDGPGSGFPTCPDCGGTGNLRDAIGTFLDTRVMRKQEAK